MAKGYLKIDAPIKEDDKIYLIIRNNAKKKTYFLLSQEIMPNNIAYTDSLSSFAALNISGFHHHRINHSKQFANQQTILTVLKTFKIRQNISCENTTESTANLSHYSWKNANFSLTSAHRLSSFKPCGISVKFKADLRQPQK